MKISTPVKLQNLFYVAVDTSAGKDDERFGLSIGRLYAGVYNNVLYAGVLDEHGCLPC